MSTVAVGFAHVLPEPVMARMGYDGTARRLSRPRIQLDFDDLIDPSRRATIASPRTVHPLEEEPERWDGLS